MLKTPIALALLLTLGGATAVTAEDAGLYAAPPPPNVAFVRIINANVAAEAGVNLGGIDFMVPPGSVSDYQFVTMGAYDAAVPQGKLPVTLEAQKFYTLLLGSGADAVLEDAAIANPVRAGLYFYNATSTPLDLQARVNGKQAVVFSAVAPGTAVSREVNAFDVTFVVTSADATMAELPAITMVRQQGVSVVALDAGGKVTAIQAVNAISSGD